MGTYISMNASIIVPNTEPVKKILCETVLSYWPGTKEQVMQTVKATTDEELIKKVTIKQILKQAFDIDNISKNDDMTTYDISFNDDCSYDWPNELRKMFTLLIDHVSDGSEMTIESDDYGGWYESYKIKNGKLIYGERHYFFTDDSGHPSDDEIAEAIVKAAEIINANPSARLGLAKAFNFVTSVQNIIDTLPS